MRSAAAGRSSTRRQCQTWRVDNIGDPTGPGEIRGLPAPAAVAAPGRNEAVAAQLWRESERLTGVTYAALGDVAA